MKASQAFIDTDNAITIGIYSQAPKKKLKERENIRKGNLSLSTKLHIHTKNHTSSERLCLNRGLNLPEVIDSKHNILSELTNIMHKLHGIPRHLDKSPKQVSLLGKHMIFLVKE